MGENVQIVCDLKLASLILGIQTASSMHGCPFCDRFEENEQAKKNLRGKYKEIDGQLVVMRTWNNIRPNNDKYLLETHPNRSKLKD